MAKLVLTILLFVLLAGAQSAPAVSFPATPDSSVAAQQRWGSAMLGSVVSGCLHATSASPSVSLASCRGFALDTTDPPTLRGFEEPVARTITYSGGDGTYWLSARANPAVTPASWTSVPGTHYVWIRSATHPTIPSGLVLLSQSTVSGGAVTAVQDWRPGNPFGPVINALDPVFGVVADGVTDDTAALEAVCARLTPQLALPDADQRFLVFPGNRVYRIPNGGWDCELPNNTIVFAYGATFESTTDHATPLVTLNANGDCSAAGGCLNPLRNVWWLGGTFFNTITQGTATQAVAMDVQAIRGFTIRDSNFQGFWRAMQVTVQDNFYVQNTNFTCHGIDGACIIQPDDANQSASDGWSIENCLFQGQSSPSDYAIYKGQGGLTRQAYIRNNTFAGDFDIGHIVWEAGNAASVSPSTNLRIENNHFEQMPPGGHFIWLQSTTSAFGYENIRITGNNTAMAPCDLNCTGIEVNVHLHVATIQNNRVNIPAGANTRHIVLTGTIADVGIGPEQTDGDLTQFLDLSGVTSGTRADVTIFPSTKSFNEPQSFLTGFGGTVDVSDSAQPIDMSVAFPLFPARIPPKGYFLNVVFRDSGSAAATNEACYVRFAQSAAAIVERSLLCSCGGFVNDSFVHCSGYVPADVNGDIYLQAETTGANTMNIWVGVPFMLQ